MSSSPSSVTALDTLAPAPSSPAWREGFSTLGPAFFTRLRPTPLPSPNLVAISEPARQLVGWSAAWLASDDALQALAGNAVPEGSDPLATVYSGHQFGVWAGQLGDGRAILLGETDSGFEVQLKGAGRTPYSRMGDGRAVLRSSIREFLCSEAMHALGIPTTRALALVGSPAPVARESIETAAVVTRVAPSFIRFGHFEHFAARGQHDELRQLADFVIDRFYPDCRSDTRFGGNAYASLLNAVSERTAALMAQWQAVGFCHGVMNTDNMSILGLTIDYGPFQFLDGFNPAHICNHSDSQGRYAYNAQPNVAYWNLFCLAQALMPLIGEEELALAALKSYREIFPLRFEAAMLAKLGLAQPVAGDAALLEALLRVMAAERIDWTIFWRRFAHYRAGGPADPLDDLFVDRTSWRHWLSAFERRPTEADAAAAVATLRANPRFVLRNHLGQQAIEAAQKGDFSGVHTLLALLEAPFDEHPGMDAYADFPPDWASAIEISCSS